MNAIKRVVIFAVILCTISLHAMKRPRTEIVEENGPCKKQAIEEQPCFGTFPSFIQQKILPSSAIVYVSETCIVAASTLESLSRTCKTLNAHINKRPIMLDIIREISTIFNQSQQFVGQILSIKTAKEIHDAQELLYAYMRALQVDPRYVIQPLDRLAKTLKVDVHYTYDRNQQTPLATILKEPYNNEAKSKIIDWLLEHGASINSITRNNDSAASIALRCKDLDSFQKFCSHKDFNPNHVGESGNTLLHDCIMILQRKKNSSRHRDPFLRKVDKIMPIILELLRKKTDISVANHAEETPLMLAIKLDHEPITRLLELEMAEITATSR